MSPAPSRALTAKDVYVVKYTIAGMGRLMTPSTPNHFSILMTNSQL